MCVCYFQIKVALSVCIPLVAMAIATVVVAILLITRKKKNMYDLNGMKSSSEIEIKAISNAMYGKMESCE